MKGFIAVAGASVCFASAGVAQSEPKYKELPNFRKVNEQLYRGAQPHGGIQQLAQLGVNTIVNLRADDKRSQTEEQEAKAAELSYFNVPFQMLGRPTAEQVQRVLSIISSPENQPVFSIASEALTGPTQSSRSTASSTSTTLH